MEAAVGVIAAVMTMSQAYSQHQKSTEQGRQTLDQGEEARQTTLLLEGRDRFTKQINGEFEEISLQTNIIREIDSHLTKLEQRITTILSDYTALLNQVSIVSTLMLGVATATFGSLLGNTEDQPKWKVNLYVISCIFTIISVYLTSYSFLATPKNVLS